MLVVRRRVVLVEGSRGEGWRVRGARERRARLSQLGGSVLHKCPHNSSASPLPSPQPAPSAPNTRCIVPHGLVQLVQPSPPPRSRTSIHLLVLVREGTAPQTLRQRLSKLILGLRRAWAAVAPVRVRIRELDRVLPVLVLVLRDDRAARDPLRDLLDAVDARALRGGEAALTRGVTRG